MAMTQPAKRPRTDGSGSSAGQVGRLGAAEELTFAAEDVALPGTCVFLKEPSSSLNCPICMSVLTDAATLLTCQHVFCRECIEEALSRKRECPTCRKKCSPVPKLPNLLAKNHLVNNIVGELQVHCRFGLSKDSNGLWAASPGPHMCTKVLPIDAVASHEALCEYARVTCPFQGCGCVVLRSQLQVHLEGNMGKHLMLMQSALEQKDSELAKRDAKIVEMEGKVSKIEQRMDDMGMVLATVMGGSRLGQSSSRGGRHEPRMWKWDERRQVLTEVVPAPNHRSRRVQLGDSEEDAPPVAGNDTEEQAAHYAAVVATRLRARLNRTARTEEPSSHIDSGVSISVLNRTAGRDHTEESISQPAGLSGTIRNILQGQDPTSSNARVLNSSSVHELFGSGSDEDSSSEEEDSSDDDDDEGDGEDGGGLGMADEDGAEDDDSDGDSDDDDDSSDEEGYSSDD